jgi:acetylornithine deacetylase/succinyl-diaminopimelate desuccinylase-like protein
MKLLKIAETLVGFDTVSQSASTVKIANFVSKYCEDAGFKIEQYHYKNEGLQKVNVVARKGGCDSELCLSGHMDTVPFNTSD